MKIDYLILFTCDYDCTALTTLSIKYMRGHFGKIRKSSRLSILCKAMLLEGVKKFLNERELNERKKELR